MEIAEFRELVLSGYRKAGRKFPWRGANPWGVMVSEFMLQQTQTERVVPFYENFIQLWPDPESLAMAPLEEALRKWCGLGYNSRCRNLRDSAVIIVEEFNGKVPETSKDLQQLPGVGPYIAGAISCFAYNYPAVFIETNIRSAMIHCFFPDRNDVKDSEIFPLLEEALDKSDPRTWYYALMDYGSELKKTGNPGRRSAHYVQQSPFIGSFRQARGKVIKALVTMGPGTIGEILFETGLNAEKLYNVLEKLEKESLVAEDKGIYRIKN